MLRLTSAVLLAFTFLIPAQADTHGVYSWTDADGNVHYSDRPASETARLTEVTSRTTDLERVAAARPDLNDKEEETVTDDAPPKSADTEDEDPVERATRYAENCRRAQTALQTITNSRRLYVPTDGGGRRYLDQAETDTRRAQAQADVSKWCG
ncbi:MAG: DUF4124 domain-containing protein [Pseudomonadota bacterium]